MTELFRGKFPEEKLDALIEKRKRKGLSLDSVGYRFELYRVYLGLNAFKFSRLLSFSPASYSEIQADISKPSCQTIINIFKLEENPVDVRWLLVGDRKDGGK